MKMGMKTKRRWNAVVFHVIVGGIAIFMFYPIAWMFLSSFKPTDQVMTTAAQLIPSQWTILNYITGWKGFDYNYSTCNDWCGYFFNYGSLWFCKS